MEGATGLRERKKQQTREAIERAARELFCARGYEETTLADIAEAAGVSTRTIFSYFPGKEDILFCGFESLRGTVARALAERPGGRDALGTLRDLIVSAGAGKSELDETVERIVEGDETLRSHKRARLSQLRDLLAAAIADDLGAGPDDLRPHIAASSLTAAFEASELHGPRAPRPRTPDEIAAVVDPIFAFVRAGLEALPAPAP